MLLGFIVSQRGIEPNPEKVSAITQMGPIRDLKGVQKVMGCLAALSQFISRLGEKGLPLYRLLRKSERFSWTPKAQEALDKLKASLTIAPILTPPVDGKPPLPIRGSNDSGRQRSHHCGTTRGGTRSACPEAGVLHQ